ncbi:MFS transporter [Nocardioides campestrisoli]|uniref:MFS transporter n=1 Tax=Nocardioides campestrisoli TaxID=2736757 RepID=UPI0015E74DCE|nr:MFS transporter [Nocardioides campestrisoli]
MKTTEQPTTGGILSPTYLATTVAAFSLIAIVAFESLAVTTVMPDVAQQLGGVELYALAFAAPLASGVVGMVIAGMWSDRSGPTVPLLTALTALSFGLVACGLAPTMEVLVAGRILQGLGGGAATVVLYVVVGLVYPRRLQPSILASFAAAWVLPSLFGPYLAALIADAFGWRWVFLGVVALIGLALVTLTPTLRTVPSGVEEADPPQLARLGWAVVAGAAVLGVKLLDSSLWLAGGCLVLVLFSLSRLMPPGTVRLGRGLPSVIATRGLLSAGFFCAEAYIVFVLQERWGIAAATAGLALTGVGVVWALASQAQARLPKISHTRALVTGTSVVLLGITLLTVVVWLEAPAPLAMAAYVLAGAGMGFGFPRLGVAMLEHSSDRDRGANSSALAAADSLSAALALAITGVVFARTEAAGLDAFVAVYLVAILCSAGAVAAASRTASHEPVRR